MYWDKKKLRKVIHMLMDFTLHENNNSAIGEFEDYQLINCCIDDDDAGSE